MKKIKNKTMFTGFAILLGFMLVAGVIYYGGKEGWFSSLSVVDDSISGILDKAPLNPTGAGCKLYLSEEEICSGDTVTGSIVEGANELCYVYAYDGVEWFLVYSGYTDGSGNIDEEREIYKTGTFTFLGVCDTNSNSMLDFSDCFTNRETLVVENCSDGSDDDDSSDDDDTVYTCGWVGQTCSGTCPSSHPTCVDVWSIAYTFCACIDDGGEIHEDWKPGGSNHDTSGEPDSPPPPPPPEPEPDYYDMTDATYWVHYDSFTGGSPLRMRGDFTTWNFVTASSGSGSEEYVTLDVTFGGNSVSIPIDGHSDINLDDFMEDFDGYSGNIVFESKFVSGYTRYRSEYSGTVDMS